MTDAELRAASYGLAVAVRTDDTSDAAAKIERAMRWVLAMGRAEAFEIAAQELKSRAAEERAVNP